MGRDTLLKRFVANKQNFVRMEPRHNHNVNFQMQSTMQSFTIQATYLKVSPHIFYITFFLGNTEVELGNILLLS